MGLCAQATLEQDVEGYVLFMAHVMEGWKIEEIRAYITELIRELRSGKSHGYYRLKAVWGRKPEST